MTSIELRACKGCGQTLPTTEFPVDHPGRAKPAGSGKGGPARRLSKCRACKTVDARRHYQTSTKRRVYLVADNFNRTARKRKAEAVNLDRHALAAMILETPKCRYCLLPNANEGRGFHLDHVTSLSQGGEHSLSNIALCCDRCNRAKWDSEESVFRAWLEGAVSRLSEVG